MPSLQYATIFSNSRAAERPSPTPSLPPRFAFFSCFSRLSRSWDLVMMYFCFRTSSREWYSTHSA